MTYSIDFRKQVLRSIKDGMTIREAAAFYELSTSSIHSWQQSLVPKTTRNKAPTKISNEALLKDVKQYPDDYMYERDTASKRKHNIKNGVYSSFFLEFKATTFLFFYSKLCKISIFRQNERPKQHTFMVS